MAGKTIERLLAKARGIQFATSPFVGAERRGTTFTRGYIPDRKPHDGDGFYDIGYFTGEKAEVGISFSPDGAFLNPESHYKFKWQDTVRWISSYIPGEGRVLDAGGGPNHFAYWAKKMNAPFTVFGSDVSQQLLRSEHNQNPGQSVVSEINRLPFRDQIFKGVLFSDVLEHVWPHEAVEAIKEAHRVLEDGARLFIRIPNRNTWTPMAWHDEGHVWLPNKKELEHLLVLGGFDSRSIDITTRGLPLRRTSDMRSPILGRALLATAKK